ncbi:hypothetical protein VNO77_34898 [Canavalia gladiata]|uniref:Cystinosin, lysosomal cystine transporter n=1 Tax=Canavalia gladiata TaxID=3824 RepID=A0AAN9KES8_CANGL
MASTLQETVTEMVQWNSFPLEVSYQVVGWLAFISWALGGYPQIILNFHRKSPLVQKQYFDKFGYGQMIPVAANDVAFSTYSVILNLIILSQIAMFDRGRQKFSKYAIVIVAVVWFSAAICFFIALPTQSWLWLISIFNLCKSIILQLNSSSYDPHQIFSPGSWVNFYGNIGKVLLSLVTIAYDSTLMCQHYILYHDMKGFTSKTSEEIKQTLIGASPIDQQIKGSVKSSHHPPAEV